MKSLDEKIKASKILVRRVGFEPATPWFVARYSIQLSYRRARTLLCGISIIVSSIFSKKLQKNKK